ASSSAISPDGRWLACGTWGESDGKVRVWEISSARLAAQLPVNTFQLAFSPDGRWLTTGTDGDYRFFHSGSWKLERVIRTSGMGGGPLAYSRDGSPMALCLGPNGVWLVDPGTGAELAMLPARNCAIFSPDGRRLITGGDNQVYEVWDLH